MSKLIIKRDETRSDRLFAYVIRCDGQKVGRIKSGETLEIEIAAGAHDIRVSMGWLSSRTVKIEGASNDEIYLTCGRNPFSESYDGELFYLTIGCRRYLSLERELPETA